MKKNLLTICCTLTICILLGGNIAHAGDFTIYPTYKHGDNSAWIIKTANAGQTINDWITLENLTDTVKTISLNIYDAQDDGNKFKIEDGQTDKTSAGISSWTFVPESVYELNAKEKITIPVTIKIPKTVNPDEYVGTILASESFLNDQNVKVVTRIGVRIYLTINNNIGLQTNIFETDTYKNSIFILLSLTAFLGSLALNVFAFRESKQNDKK